MRQALVALTNRDLEAAAAVTGRKAEINRLVNSAARHEANRLVASAPHRLAAYRVEVDVIEKLKRIYYFAKRIAKAVLPEEEGDGGD